MGPQQPLNVADFTILPVTFPSLPSFAKAVHHNLYIRPHEPKVPTSDSPRSLFVVNIPIDTTPSHLRALFATGLSAHGRVERVDCEETAGKRSTQTAGAGVSTGSTRNTKKSLKRKAAQIEAEEEVGDLQPDLPSTWDRTLHRSGSSAIVVFVDRPAMESAMKAVRRAAKARKQVTWGFGVTDDSQPPLGSARYKAHAALQHPDPELLQRKADDYLTAFAEFEAARTRRNARQRAEPDADGFVTVTRGGRTGPGRDEEAQLRLQRMRDKERRTAEALDGFYRFQGRERRKREARSLADKFELDKQRVEAMRRQRGALKPL